VEPVKTFILAGQSNMAGMGEISELAAEMRQAPNNISIVEYKARNKFAEPWFGPEVTFAHEIAKAWAKERILIIKFAVDSSSLLAWLPDWSEKEARITDNADVGPLYQKLLKFIETVTFGIEVRFIGMMWMQGERDAKFQESANNYAKNFEEFIYHIRIDLNSPQLPFIYGQVNPPAEQFPFVQTVRDAQVQIEHQVSGIKMIITDDLRKLEDRLHYNARGLKKMGRRFVRAFLYRQYENQ
jgi:hypothetical protein